MFKVFSFFPRYHPHKSFLQPETFSADSHAIFIGFSPPPPSTDPIKPTKRRSIGNRQEGDASPFLPIGKPRGSKWQPTALHNLGTTRGEYTRMAFKKVQLGVVFEEVCHPIKTSSTLAHNFT
jgi:hypothetical protein